MKTKLADHDQFMTTEEVLEYLQVNLRTVYRLIQRRNIPAIRVGRQWRFRRGDIEAWLETQRATAAQSGSPPSARPNGRPRLLLVDDEPSSLDLTGYSSESSAIEAVNLGVGGYLVKPFRAADVMAVVARALSVPAA